MAIEVKIPSLGESVTEAVIGHWIKQDGDLVAVDEPLLELESDKANMELAAEQAGILRILRKEGETVTVGDVIATIEPASAQKSEAPAASAPEPKAAPAPPQAKAPAPEPAPQAPAAQPSEEPRLSPAVRRIVTEEKLDVSGVQGTGPGGRLTKADVLEIAAQRREKPPTEEPARAPEQRRTASVSSIGGAAAAEAPAPAPRAAPAAAPRPSAEGDADERVPMTRLRQVIARRLVEAQHTAAILTTFNEVDMSAILELRKRHREAFQAKHGIGLGFMGFFVKACCAAATEVRELNAEIQGTDLVYHRSVHMGIAVGTDRGLVVPVVRNADRISIAEIEREIARLAGLARDNKLSIDDLSGATFTISNGGVYGSLLSTPILTPPQAGILGMHKTEKRPVVIDDRIEVRPMMYVALSYDHRIVDGKGAVTFLVHVKEALEDPSRLLLGV